MTKLNYDQKILLAIRAVRSITDIFLGTFLLAHFLKIGDSNVVPVSLYQITWAGIIGLMFVLMGDFVKRKNKLISFRISALLNIFYLLCIVFLIH